MKDLHFNDEGRIKLIRGITQLSNAVKSTLGPSGHTVLIESPEHTAGITVTKDGVTVARSVELIDPVENLAVQIMKQAASRTATEAGDGTTTSIVLAEALVREGIKQLTPDVNKTEVLRELRLLSEEVVKGLEAKSKKVTSRQLRSVATISANNDREVGKIIADAYGEVGKDGIVTVERSEGSQTYYKATHGIKVDRGYSSNMFINDQRRDECILSDCDILVSDAEINNILSIENILAPIIREGGRLLIIAPCSGGVINTLAANVIKRGLKVCVIPPPSFGYKQHELMSDIALAVGATYFSEKTGDDMSHMEPSDLGHAERVIIGQSESIIIKDGNIDVLPRVEQLWEAHAAATKRGDRDFIMSRIASLTGGIGVIYVGGHTDLEQKELFDRVDDAVCAVRSALIEGILPGSGVALYHASLGDGNSIANKILNKALASPLLQILLNAGIEMSADRYDRFGYGVDIKTGDWGELLKLGVIDPTRVTKSALQNAVSVAITILSTNAIITMARA